MLRVWEKKYCVEVKCHRMYCAIVTCPLHGATQWTPLYDVRWHVAFNHAVIWVKTSESTWPNLFTSLRMIPFRFCPFFTSEKFSSFSSLLFSRSLSFRVVRRNSFDVTNYDQKKKRRTNLHSQRPLSSSTTWSSLPSRRPIRRKKKPKWKCVNKNLSESCVANMFRPTMFTLSSFSSFVSVFILLSGRREKTSSKWTPNCGGGTLSIVLFHSLFFLVELCIVHDTMLLLAKRVMYATLVDFIVIVELLLVPHTHFLVKVELYFVHYMLSLLLLFVVCFVVVVLVVVRKYVKHFAPRSSIAIALFIVIFIEYWRQ